LFGIRKRAPLPAMALTSRIAGAPPPENAK
jgi:hypothetical protein